MKVKTAILSKTLEKKMNRKCWSRQNLAGNAGVSIQCVNGFFNGRNSPSISNFLKICDALDLEFTLYEPKKNPA